MKLWISRDYTGSLCIWAGEPTRVISWRGVYFWNPFGCLNLTLADKDDFEEVTTANSPKQVEIKLCVEND